MRTRQPTADNGASPRNDNSTNAGETVANGDGVEVEIDLMSAIRDGLVEAAFQFGQSSLYPCWHRHPSIAQPGKAFLP